ncbi:MAG: glycosyltransferase [Bacteroidales bacterium]|nr:glycosyltransferase [Candidatus Scybalocola fimicaballi]
MKKEILIDLMDLHEHSGFGEIERMYANIFSKLDVPDMHFNFLVRSNQMNAYGDKVGYLEHRSIYKIFPFLLRRFDLWHSVHQLYRECPRNKTTKRILTIHDLNFLYEKNEKKAKKYLNAVCDKINNAHHLVAISNFAKEEVLKNCKMKEEKPFDVILNGVRDTSNDNKTKPSFMKPDRKFLCAVGAVREKKNIHVLLDMMKYLPEYELYVCGSTAGEYAEKLKERIKTENISNVTITGTITDEEKNWLYDNMEALMFPSRLEGFGLPIIEAMHFKKAVFSSPYSSLPEICSTHAYVWKELDPEYMATLVREKITEFYADPSHAEAEKEYANTYSYERHIKGYIALYRRMLGLPEIEINL